MSTAKLTIFDEVRCQFTGIAPQHMTALIDKYAILTEYYKYNADFILGLWDGKTRFFWADGRTYVFLMPEIMKIIKRFGYSLEIYDKRISPFYDAGANVDENYFKHITNPKDGNPYKLSDHQIEAANLLIEAGSGIALAGTGFGKAQPLNCKVMTPYGWKRMGDMEVGDLVCTPKNTITRVMSVHDQGKTDVYKITLADGSFTYAHPKHLWVIKNNRFAYDDDQTRYLTLTTLELKAHIEDKNTRLWGIPLFPVPTDLPPTNQPFDPYIVGSLLPYCSMFNKKLGFRTYQDPKLRGKVLAVQDELYAKYGFKHSPYTSKGCKLKFRDRVLYPHTDYARALYDFLVQCLENPYRIPKEYIFCSLAQRTAFLRGFCDVTGYVDHKGVTSVVMPNYEYLKEQITEMVVFNGCMVAPIDTVKYTDKIYYKMKIYNPNVHDEFVTRPERKEKYTKFFDPTVRPVYNTRRTVVSVEREKRQETRCIYIEDDDHLYITDYGIITHNTILNGVLVDKYNRMGCKTLTVVPAKSLITQTIKQFKTLNLDVSHYSSTTPSLDHDHIVTTWQTLKNVPQIVNNFQMVVIDECLSGETDITYADGSTKKIKDVEPGDIIVSYNLETNQFDQDIVEKRHENILKSSNEKMYCLEFDNGVFIEVTGNHCFLTNMGYIRADELTDDHEIIEIRGYDDTFSFSGTAI